MYGKAANFFGAAVERSGLVGDGDSGVVLVSGGADSVALLVGLVEFLGPEGLVAFHVNYGLREEADADQELVAGLCEQLGVELIVHKPGPRSGNLQAWAREVRLGEAERIRSGRELDWIAVGHNRTDLVETVLYRLASSPGVRSLLAMPPRSGKVIRPLLDLDRDAIRRSLEYSGYAEDQTNEDPGYARNRIRHRILPELEAINPAAGLNLVRTRAELVEDEKALGLLAEEAGPAARTGPGSGLDGEVLLARHPAIRRRMLRGFTEEILGRPVAVTREISDGVVRLLTDPEGGMLDLGGGDRFVIRRGRVEVESGADAGSETIPEPAEVPLESGIASFGAWSVESSRTTEHEARAGFGTPWVAYLDCKALGESLLGTPSGTDDRSLILRPWRYGDRIRPLGMEGTRKLQDVFTDALVPAPLRRTWPVMVIADEVIWVPGLIRSSCLLVGGADNPVLRLEARPPFDP
jgi:tRNA(Ile)-lysidine synthase